MFAFTKLSLARQFMLISLLLLLTGMVAIGTWVSHEIRQGVLNRTAAVTALYVDSIIAPRLQALADGEHLQDADLETLSRVLSETSLGQQIVSLKVWSPAGSILYSPNTELIGQQFVIEGKLARALDGEVVSGVTQLDQPEYVVELRSWDQLIETYAPVRAAGSKEIIAVSEFYQRSDDFMAEIRLAQLRSWLAVGVGVLIMYVLLAGMVGRASNTILAQQRDLEEQLTRVRALLAQNQQLHGRVRRAAARSTALNEQFLRRISADLHDGPGQDLALALMRVDTLCTGFASGSSPSAEVQVQQEDVCIVQNALDSALRELRAISAGLRLPEFAPLSPSEVTRRAIRDYESKTGKTVQLNICEGPQSAPVPVKITLYRVLQETLANSFQHANGAAQLVNMWSENGYLHLEIADDGPGFEPRNVAKNGHLGLAGMRERVELLGGDFSIDTAPGKGACVRVIIPLDQATA